MSTFQLPRVVVLEKSKMRTSLPRRHFSYFLSPGNEEHFGGMNQSKTGSGTRASAMRQFAVISLCLLALLGFLFRDGLAPGRTVFSNDGPLGAISAECARSPQVFFGFWQNLNWLGATGPGAPSDIRSESVV